MPQPPFQADDADPIGDDPPIYGLLKTILFEVSAERSIAATRHEALLTKLLEQQQAFPCASCSVVREASLNGKSVVPMKQSESSGTLAHAQKVIATTDETHIPVEDILEPVSWHTNEAGTVSEIPTNSTTPNSRRTTKLAKHSKLKFKKKGSFSELAELVSVRSKIIFLVNHEYFETCFVLLILFNAFVMCLEIQYQGFHVGFILQYEGCMRDKDDVWPSADHAFSFFDWTFGILFCLEMFGKVTVMLGEYFLNFWNWVDSFCVLAFVIDKLASAWFPIKPQALRLIRIFRLVRLVRLIRTLEHLEMLYVMTTAIKGMSMVVVWGIGLMSIILTTCALFLTQFLHSTYFHDVADEKLSPEHLEKHRLVYQYFGTFTRCLFTMFELTLANWAPVARILAEEISEWFMGILVMHKLLIGVAVVGVINGVILQETFKVAHTDDTLMMRQKSREKRRLLSKMNDLFDSLDFDKSDTLDYEEFLIIADHQEVRMWLQSMDVETDDLSTLFQIIDTDGDGSISRDELVTKMPRLRGSARGIDVISLCRGLSTQWIRNTSEAAQGYSQNGSKAAFD